MTVAFLVYAITAALSGESCRKSLLTGIFIFSASLFADQIWPPFEPVYLGCFHEIAGACFILILGAILLSEVQQLRHRQENLEQQQVLYQEQLARQEQEALNYLGQYEGTLNLSEKMIFPIIIK